MFNRYLKIIFFFAFLTLPSIILATTWVTNASTTSTYTSPDPYDNYSDITTTLTISGAAALEITISGVTESGYDFLYITDQGGNTQTFDGTLSTTITVVGDSISLRFVSDYIVTREGVTVSIVSTSVPVGPDICPGTILQNLNGTSVTATDAYNNITVPANTIYYYSFTPAESGTIQTNSSATNTTNSLYIYDGCGGSLLWSNTLYGGNKSSPNINVTAGQQIIIAFERDYSTSTTLDIDFTYTVILPAPPIINVPDSTINIGESLSIDLSAYTTEPNGDTITYGATGLPTGMSINTSTGLITGTPTGVGVFTVTVTATDTDGSDTNNFTITVLTPPVIAGDESFTTPPNTPLSDTTRGNDSGYNITMTAITVQPSNGTLTFQSGGNFTYTPNIGYTGTDSFSYEITDAFGTTATATVSINVTLNTDYQSGVQDFELINPLNTRNIIGNYIIAGNTIQCITTDNGSGDDKSDPASFNNTCTDSMSYNDNNYMSQYIDIDGDSGTWNSSSSNFELPTTQSGILWAGLFWQGALHNESGSYPQRRGYLNSSGTVAYKYITSDEALDMETTEANKLLLKLDNEATYSEVQAQTFYYDTAFNSDGGYYAAYADVTYELQRRNLTDGNHTAMIANLTSTEGRESGIGNIGGWSLVIIYAESGGGAKARNISVYNGFTVISSSSGTRNVAISGFKLPSSGTVNSTFAAFAGEGEEIYDPDTMFISKYSDLSDPQDMPNAIDSNNIFDARLANIARDTTGDNDVTNANGIDIENYDVSDIMTAYRDADANIDTVYIGLNSGGDYITPSMMAFATELYRPKICIDYTVQKNNFDITQDGRIVNSRGTGKLSATLALQSLEGDFDFINTQIGVRMVPSGGTSFNNAYYSPNNVNTFLQAYFTASSTPTAPMIAIGENAGVNGGTVKRNQRYFARFDYNMTSLNYSGKFEVDLNTTINFGSGEVPSFQSTQYDDISRCDQNLTYAPVRGSFNIERTDSGNENGVTNPELRYPLYTQVVGKDFDFRLVAYDQSSAPTYTTELALTDYTIDIELIDAAPFNDAQSIFTCNNPDPGIVQNLDSLGTTNIFAAFPDSSLGQAASSDVNLSSLNIQTDKALKNAAFRIWYLVDENNTILPHKCTDKNSNGCFETLYNDNIRASDTTVQVDGTIGLCQDACSASSGYAYSNVAGESGCYACLKDFFGRAVCSRDNFAIRPASYRVQIADNGQSTSLTASETVVGENDTAFTVPAPFSPTTTLAAGYDYKLDGIATSYVSDTTVALGYYREFNQQTSPSIHSALTFNTTSNPAACVDQNTTYWDIDFDNGTMKNSANFAQSNLHRQSDVGFYNYQIADANWTLVDQSSYAYKTFPGVDDCLPTLSSVASSGTAKSGCITNTTLTVNGEEYTDLEVLYRPYRFDISGVNYVKHPSTGGTLSNGDEYTYLNDLNSSYYNPSAPLIDMAVSFEGNITALGADDVQLLNFTNLCMANDLSLELSRTTNPDERTALVNVNGDAILFQQALQHTSILNQFVDQQEGIDKNVTLPKISFPENGTSSGIATMYLHTTFKKPLNSPVNPFRVTYNDLNTTGKTGGIALRSYANKSVHTPIGGKTYDQNLTYLFAKVTPKEFIYQNVLKSFKQTPISVDIYCDGNTSFCNNFDLNSSSLNTDETANWYSAANIFNSLNDGTTDLVAGTDDGAVAGPSVSPNTAIAFIDSNASKIDINVTITGAGRPSTVGIDIRPVPWLRFDKDGLNANGYPHYQVQFIDGAGWSGIGNTGEVVETKSSNQATPRMNW